ncbi:MAG: ThuA domain-containing protein [Candidatus Binataceae bacterium]
MAHERPTRVHLIAGGYPPGLPAGHDMDYARLRILELLSEYPRIRATVANDFTDIARWLPETQLLVTYLAGPYANDEQCGTLRQWLEGGGRWFGLHGTSGGKAVPVPGDRYARKMVKTSHHETLGCFFLNHPPVRRFRVNVADRSHALTRGLPASFEVQDELYLIELQDPVNAHLLLTTELPKDPSPKGFGFAYDADTSLLADGKTRALGYVREIGKGGVAYIALGHCHSPSNNVQPFVDSSIHPEGKTPLLFRGSWETSEFQTLLRNAIEWGIGEVPAEHPDLARR